VKSEKSVVENIITSVVSKKATANGENCRKLVQPAANCLQQPPLLDWRSAAEADLLNAA